MILFPALFAYLTIAVIVACAMVAYLMEKHAFHHFDEEMGRSAFLHGLAWFPIIIITVMRYAIRGVKHAIESALAMDP